jgi:hypothetical protein
VGIQKVGGDGECIGWSEVWVEGVDGVGNGTLAGSTYIGNSSHTADAGADAGASLGGARVGTKGTGGG